MQDFPFLGVFFLHFFFVKYFSLVSGYPSAYELPWFWLCSWGFVVAPHLMNSLIFQRRKFGIYLPLCVILGKKEKKEKKIASLMSFWYWTCYITGFSWWGHYPLSFQDLLVSWEKKQRKKEKKRKIERYLLIFIEKILPNALFFIGLCHFV